MHSFLSEKEYQNMKQFLTFGSAEEALVYFRTSRNRENLVRLEDGNMHQQAIFWAMEVRNTRQDPLRRLRNEAKDHTKQNEFVTCSNLFIYQIATTTDQWQNNR
jgi:hypothetical protein